MVKAMADAEQQQHTEDYALVQRAIEGDQRAYTELQKQYAPLIRRVIRKMLRNPDIEEDVLQDVLLKVFTSLKRYAPTHPFAAWVYRIASNHCIDVLRKRQLPTQSLERFYAGEDRETQRYEIPDSSYRPDEQLQRKERHQLLHKAIEQLPEHYRRVIYLRHFEELEYQEIAERLQLPLGTVKAQLFRARAQLYRLLKKQGFSS